MAYFRYPGGALGWVPEGPPRSWVPNLPERPVPEPPRCTWCRGEAPKRYPVISVDPGVSFAVATRDPWKVRRVCSACIERRLGHFACCPVGGPDEVGPSVPYYLVQWEGKWYWLYKPLPPPLPGCPYELRYVQVDWDGYLDDPCGQCFDEYMDSPPCGARFCSSCGRLMPRAPVQIGPGEEEDRCPECGRLLD